MMNNDTTTPTGFLLDMDGVLFRGDQPVPGATAFMSHIEQYPHCFITNNPILAPQQVAAKLNRLGIAQATPEQVVTSAQATAAWLAEQKTDFRYYAVGANGLHWALEEKGRQDSVNADFVVVGEGVGLDYETLTIGINLILQQGARLVCTNPDINVDGTKNGEPVILPGGAALVAPFATATNAAPVFIGKPAPALYEMAMKKLGLTPWDCIMIGDRPDTDILGAQRLGIRTVLVRTGRFRPGEPLPRGMAPPDWDVESLGEFIEAITN